MRRPWHGGQNARDWRRKVASIARRQRESVATYKFRLRTQPGDIDFDAAARAYGVTEDVAKGSLIGLLCAVHLSGFRLFSKGDETRQFRERNRYPVAAFCGALKNVGIENPGVTIQSIENVFSTPPRARGGELPEWSSSALSRRLFQKWNGRSPQDKDRGAPEPELAEGIAREVAQRFGGWKELADNIGGALACTDGYLTKLGSSFPALSALPPETAIKPDNCTLACDLESPFVAMTGNEEIWLHQTVAVCAARLMRDMPTLDPSSGGFAVQLKNSIVTTSNNGMSWLFGNGLRYLKESDVQVIADDLSVPRPEHRRVEQLKNFADIIPGNPFFDTDIYPEFRGSTGGKVSSWVANYWKRIGEISTLHAQPPSASIPAALQHEENERMFSGQHTGAAGLAAMADRLPQRISDAGHALAILRGEGGVPAPEHIARIEEITDEVVAFSGQISMLDNRIEQEIERCEDKDRKQALQTLRSSLPKSLRKPPKLNRISGGVVDVAEEIGRLQDDLNDAVRDRRAHFQRIATWAEGAAAPLDCLPVMAERERRALLDRGQNPTLADEQAVRRLIHRIVGMSRRLSTDTANHIRGAVVPLFEDKKDANRYFHNRQGALYRHPFSTSRHEAYRIDVGLAHETDWLAFLDDRAEGIRNQSADDMDGAVLRDLLTIEGFVFTQRLGGLPNRIPGTLARPQSRDGLIDIPPLLRAQLDANEVPRDAAVRAFNLFHSAINGLFFRAFRDRFIVRAKFQRLEHDELFYAPKDKAWRPPADYLEAKGDISRGLALPAIVRSETGDVLTYRTAESLSKAKFPEPGSRSLLRQAPHDWFVELDLRRGDIPERAGFPVKQNRTGLKRWRPLKRPAFGLTGSPSFKTWLDRAMNRKDVKIGDYTLIIDQTFKQSLRVENGKILLTAEPLSIDADLAVPVVDLRPYAEREKSLLFDNIVAIDLGEKRIGFAVFSLVDLLENGVLDPVTGDDERPAVGTVAVPALRKLMGAVRRHRRSRQPNQKIGETYSRGLMRFRENVIGDVCNRIDTLCERFRAFPVLESSVGNFETGGRQLETIYGSVIRRYTYSGVEAHKAARSQYWFRADIWEHPYVRICEWNETKRTYSGRPKPLRLFPGVTVNPARTSQTCHRCGRNALDGLRDIPGDSIEVRPDGRVALKDGVARLLERADHPPAELKKFRRRKERPPLNAPIGEGRHRRQYLKRIVRRNMRQQPRSEMSPDTTQARFVCVYEDCGFEGHADENAAINIGRRFLDRIDVEESRMALQALTPAVRPATIRPLPSGPKD